MLNTKGKLVNAHPRAVYAGQSVYSDVDIGDTTLLMKKDTQDQIFESTVGKYECDASEESPQCICTNLFPDNQNVRNDHACAE